MLATIINYLKKPNFQEGIEILKKINNNSPLIKNISRVNNKYNFDKINYLIIRKFAELTGKKINETNYKNFLTVKTEQKKQPAAIPKKTEPFIHPLQKNLIEEEFKQKYTTYPKNIQSLIIEKGKCSRNRSKLHKECTEITGNTLKAKSKRAVKLAEIDKLTQRIKEIHELLKVWEEANDLKK